MRREMAAAREPLMVLAIVVLAALLRGVALGDRLSADEGYTWLVASSHGLGTFLDRIAAYENTPPLYYLLAWPLPHGDEAWLRLPSLVAGAGCVAALYWAVLPLGGRRAALLACGALAVAPYAVSFSDYARGFVLADLGLIVCLGAAVRRAWWVYSAGAVLALYSEYDSALFLAALAGAVAWSGIVPRRQALVRGLAPLLSLLPWLPEIIRGAAGVGHSKVSPVYPGPSFASLRDVVVRLTFGEHGTAHATSLRWLQFLAVAAVLLVAARAVTAPVFRLLAGAALGTLGLHALAAVGGADIFAARYLTELIPLGAAGAGILLSVVRLRGAVPVAAAMMAALAVAIFVQRSGRETEPDVAALHPLIAAAANGRVVVTNSAVVAYYLRDLHPRIDRPFGLGPGMDAACERGCRAGFLVVDDGRVGAGARAGPGPTRVFGPISIRATPASTGCPGRCPE